MTKEKIKNTGSNLAIKIVIGGLFLAFGIATLKMYVGFVFLIASIIAMTFSTGTEIDYEKHEIRQYTKYLWIIKGKWGKLNNYHKPIKLFTSRDQDASLRFAEAWSEKLNIPVYN